MQGTLELKESKKKNGIFTKYSSAYLTLNPQGIVIFRDATLKSQLSSYSLDLIDHIGISLKKKRKFVIHIREGRGKEATIKLGFRAAQVIVADAWVTSLEKALTEYKMLRPAPPPSEPPSPMSMPNNSLLMPTSTSSGLKRSESMMALKSSSGKSPPPPPPTSKDDSSRGGRLARHFSLDQMLLDTMSEHGPLVGGDLLFKDPAECLRLMLAAQHKMLQAKELQNPQGRQRHKAKLHEGESLRDSLERLDLMDFDPHALQAEREMNEFHHREDRAEAQRRKRLILRFDELGIDWSREYINKLVKNERLFGLKVSAPPEALTPRRKGVTMNFSHDSLSLDPGALSEHVQIIDDEEGSSGGEDGSVGGGGESKGEDSSGRDTGSGSSRHGRNAQTNNSNYNSPNGVSQKNSVSSFSPTSPSCLARASSTNSLFSAANSASSSSSSSSGSSSSLSSPVPSSPSTRFSTSVSSVYASASPSASPMFYRTSPPPPPPLSAKSGLPPPPPTSPSASVSAAPSSPNSRLPPPPPDSSPPPSPSHAKPSHFRARTLPHLSDEEAKQLRQGFTRKLTCMADGCYDDVEGWQRIKASLQSAKSAGHFCPKHYRQIEEARSKCLHHLTIDAVVNKHGASLVSVLKQMFSEHPDYHSALLRVLWISLNTLYPPEAVTETPSLRTRRRVTLTKMRSTISLKQLTTEEKKLEEKSQSDKLQPPNDPITTVSSAPSVDHFSDAAIKYCSADKLTESVKHTLFAILLFSNYGVTERLSDPTSIVLRAPVVNPPLWFVLFGVASGCKFDLRVKVLYDIMSLLIQNDFNCLSVVSQDGWQSFLIALLFDCPLVDWVDKEHQDVVKQMHNFWLNIFIILHIYTFKHAADRSEHNFGPIIRTTFATMGKMCEPNVKVDIFVRCFFVTLLSKLHGEGVFAHSSQGAHCFGNLHTLSELCVQFVSTSKFLEQFATNRASLHRLVKTALKLPSESQKPAWPMPKNRLSVETKVTTTITHTPPEPPPSAPASPEPGHRHRRGTSLDNTPKSKFGNNTVRLSIGSQIDTVTASKMDMAKLAEVAGDDDFIRSPLFTRASCIFKQLDVDQKSISTTKAASPAKIEVECECGHMVTVTIACCPKCGTRIPRRAKKLAYDRNDVLEKEKKMIVLLKQKYAALQKKAKEFRVDADALMGAVDGSMTSAYLLELKRQFERPSDALSSLLGPDERNSPSFTDALYSLHLRSSSSLWTTHYGTVTDECEDMVIVDKLLEIYKDAHVADYDSVLHPNFTEQEKSMYESAHLDYLLWVDVKEMFQIVKEVEPRSLDPMLLIDFLPKFWSSGSHKERLVLLGKFSKAAREKSIS